MPERSNNVKVDLTLEAAEWFIRLLDDDLGRDEQRRYVRWLKSSPLHVTEMLRICQLAGWLRNTKIGGASALN